MPIIQKNFEMGGDIQAMGGLNTRANQVDPGLNLTPEDKHSGPPGAVKEGMNNPANPMAKGNDYMANVRDAAGVRGGASHHGHGAESGNKKDQGSGSGGGGGGLFGFFKGDNNKSGAAQ